MKSMNHFLMMIFLVAQSLSADLWSRSFCEEEYRYMDQIALESGADKSSAFHNYTKIYSKHFKNIRNQTFNFLEIGINEGKSVKLWENYFPNATLHFIDITSDNIKYYSSRSHYHFLNQENVSALEKFGQINGPFDVILDDGGHTMNQQITSFVTLFRHMSSGGAYIIEDLHTSYWREYGGSGNLRRADHGTTIGFLKGLVDEINFTGSATQCADWDKLPQNLKDSLTEMQRDIASIQFYSSVCIIEKR
jgi:hypothetical protein